MSRLLRPGGWPFHLALMLALGLALGWIGPYGTYNDLSLGHRLVYWILSVPLIGVPASLTIRLLSRSQPAATWPLLLRLLAGAVIAGTPSTFVVIALETIFRHTPPVTALSLATIYASATLMIFLLSIPFALLALREKEDAAAGEEAVPPAPPLAEPPPVSPPEADDAVPANGSPFLRRIPAKLGTALRYLATEDHYLRVTADRGSDLILFRMADAVDELAPELGQQVHRSYWVARHAVTAVGRDGHRTFLLLADGVRIPVSRTYLPALREAGWLGLAHGG